MAFKVFALILLTFIFGITATIAQNKPPTVPQSISAGVINGRAKTLVKPAYPAAARAVNASGEVKVNVTIDETGSVISASAFSGHPLLRAAAVEAARASLFSPPLLSGQPVKVAGVLVFNFAPAQTTELTEPYWALGIMISIVQNAEPRLIAELDEDKDAAKGKDFASILRDLSKDVPEEFATQKPLFAKLAAERAEEHRQTAGELSVSLKNQLRGQKLWQYEVGENLAVAMLEAIKYAREGKNENIRVDEAALRAALQNLKKLVAAMPAEVASEFAEKVRNVAAFDDDEEPIAPKSMSRLFSEMKQFFERLDEDDE